MTLTDGHEPLPSTQADLDFDTEVLPDLGTELAALPTPDEPDVEADEDDDDTPAAEAGKTRGRRGRATSKVSARTVRTILAKHAELTAAQPEDVALLAATLGVKDNVDDLVAHILSTPRLTLTGTAELDAIVTAAAIDPFDAVAVAMSHESQSKAVWGILSALGLLDGPRPSKDGDASVAIARAAGKFTSEHTARLSAVKGLARKGN